MTDSFGRKIDYMRVSVTDRCNLRCKYCMPKDIELLPHGDILRNEEIVRMCRIASECGITRIKITGGEPFVRRDCMDIIRAVKALPKIEAVTVTTNGVELGGYLSELKAIGVTALNISLDTLDRDAYREMTGFDSFAKVRDSMERAFEMGFNVKLNCVPLKGFNDVQLVPLAELAVQNRVDVRFIEAMPIGHGRDFEGVPGSEILSILRETYPDLREISEPRGFGPAKYYTSDGFKGAIGFIDAISHGYCGSCNRVRLTSEGFLKPCLYFRNGINFRTLMRGGASDMELLSAFENAVSQKPERHLFGNETPPEVRVMSKIGG